MIIPPMIQRKTERAKADILAILEVENILTRRKMSRAVKSFCLDRALGELAKDGKVRIVKRNGDWQIEKATQALEGESETKEETCEAHAEMDVQARNGDIAMEMERKAYKTKDGREIFVAKGLGEQFGTFFRKESGSLCRVKSPAMPMIANGDEAQRNLDTYATYNKLILSSILKSELESVNKTEESVNKTEESVNKPETKEDMETLVCVECGQEYSATQKGSGYNSKIGNYCSECCLATAMEYWEYRKDSEMESKINYGRTTPIHIDKMDKHPENEKLLPKLSQEETATLRKKMEVELEPQPFVVIENESGGYYVLDGNNRLEILWDMGFNHTVPCIIKKDMPQDQQRTYIEDCALGRRNLTKEQKAEIAQRQAARGVSQDEIAKKVGQSQQWVSDQVKEVKEVRKTVEKEAIVSLAETGKTQTEIAKEVGVSQPKVNAIIKNTKSGKLHKDEIDSETGKNIKSGKNPQSENPSYLVIEELPPVKINLAEDTDQPKFTCTQCKKEVSSDLALNAQGEYFCSLECKTQYAKAKAKALLDEDAILAEAKKRREAKQSIPNPEIPTKEKAKQEKKTIRELEGSLMIRDAEIKGLNILLERLRTENEKIKKELEYMQGLVKRRAEAEAKRFDEANDVKKERDNLKEENEKLSKKNKELCEENKNLKKECGKKDEIKPGEINTDEIDKEMAERFKTEEEMNLGITYEREEKESYDKLLTRFKTEE